MLNYYINSYTGEVIVRRNLRSACRYFKRDAKKVGYAYLKTDVKLITIRVNEDGDTDYIY